MHINLHLRLYVIVCLLIRNPELVNFEFHVKIETIFSLLMSIIVITQGIHLYTLVTNEDITGCTFHNACKG